MDTVNGKSSSSGNFSHLVVDLLSEDDSIILRNSRKGIWYKLNEVKTCPIFRPRNSDENLLIDNGHRSKERVDSKNSSCEKNLSKLNLKPSRQAKCASNPVRVSQRLKNQQKDSQISMSSVTMAELIRQAIHEKSKSLIESLGKQLKGVDEKTKRSVFTKLELNERLAIIKEMYPGSSHEKKSIPNKPPNYQRSNRMSPNQSLSSSLSRINASSSVPRYPFRKSFSFLQKDTSYSEVPNTTGNKIQSNSNNTDTISSKILIRQIEELEKQNGELSQTIRDLISRNFKLEKQIENFSRNDFTITELKSKVETLTQYHDNIIDNVYQAYRQITRSLKQLKFTSNRSMSSSNLYFSNLDKNSIRRNPRCHSVDTFQNPDPNSNTIIRIKKRQSNTALNEFLSNRKLSLETELKIANENIEKIEKHICDDPVKSAISKKHILEKEFLLKHQATLETMLKSMA